MRAWVWERNPGLNGMGPARPNTPSSIGSDWTLHLAPPISAPGRRAVDPPIPHLPTALAYRFPWCGGLGGKGGGLSGRTRSVFCAAFSGLAAFGVAEAIVFRCPFGDCLGRGRLGPEATGPRTLRQLGFAVLRQRRFLPRVLQVVSCVFRQGRLTIRTSLAIRCLVREQDFSWHQMCVRI